MRWYEVSRVLVVMRSYGGGFSSPTWDGLLQRHMLKPPPPGRIYYCARTLPSFVGCCDVGVPSVLHRKGVLKGGLVQ